jgi:tRNA(Ile)-lysidine synthase
VPALPARVLRVIREHELAGPDDRLALAVSGGADSVALLWLLHQLQASADLPGTLAGLIHVNHGLRGDEAARDEAFCRALAERARLPIEVARVDVAARARASRRSIEAVARDARYEFFAEAADRLRATRVATGHTLDDQAETVLLRLLRGTGGRGLGGVRLRRGAIIRPLLHCRRAELRRYLDARGEPFCDDSSNASLAVARNRVRHRLLPVIEEIAPGGVQALARFARLFAADEALLERLVCEQAGAVVSSSDAGVQLDTGALCHLPRPIARRMIRRALEQAAPGRGFSARHLEAALELAGAGSPGGHLDVPGVLVDRRGPVLLLRPADAGRDSPAAAGQFAVALPVPGRAAVPGTNVSVSASVYEGAPSLDSSTAAGMGGGDVAVLQAASVALPFVVRSRRPGDRLRPFGSGGRRKLQDVLVDRKIPRDARDTVPIVEDAAGRIVWVAGVTIAEECRVTTPSAGVVVLKVHR